MICEALESQVRKTQSLSSASQWVQHLTTTASGAQRLTAGDVPVCEPKSLVSENAHLEVVSVPKHVLRIASKSHWIILHAGNLGPDTIKIRDGPTELYILLNLLLGHKAHNGCL